MDAVVSGTRLHGLHCSYHWMHYYDRRRLLLTAHERAHNALSVLNSKNCKGYPLRDAVHGIHWTVQNS